jgi:glycosyltransferase involved in cell wall biosynthesis/GT2 family glycosyltransferase
MPSATARIPVLYLAPWLDTGGSDKGTLDWFRFIDRNRFRPSLITTQSGPSRRLAEATRYADEVWELPELMPGNEFARFILGFLHTRDVRVVHLMNSRLGFELLPEIAHLPGRPRVVVQLHVEESDRVGYVGYVTTRYGNLVDAFSVSSRALSDALDAYDVPRAKRRVIYTGVDAEREFSPARVKPIDGLDPDRLQIVFPARLTAQKDPLLMVDVASRLRDLGVGFQLHVLGEGGLEDDVRNRIGLEGLDRHVLIHGLQLDVERWYAACDVLLLTSEFEGLPYAVYEAMAMAMPVVAPGLPGMTELVKPAAGFLVAPRDDANAYASALAALAADPEMRSRMGSAGRTSVRSEFPLERMAGEHEALYDELLGDGRLPLRAGVGTGASRSDAAPSFEAPTPDPPAPALRGRRPGATPLVSIVVPCFNHGRFLTACLRSVAEQTYRPIETIVVDDASTDPETLEVLAGAEAGGAVSVIRIDPNRGPSAARNAAIELAEGRYVLPLDADNMLLPGAVAALVEQLSVAGEQIGFVYPNYQFFGNRSDYFEPPSYNLHTLLRTNYCDTCSLIDRDVFDRGFRYPEDVAGVEDWDFVLSLAEHGIYGEPAHAKTLLYRKHGFSLVDLAEASDLSYSRSAAERHRHLHRLGTRLKARWSPAVSLIALDPMPTEGSEALPRVEAAAFRQTCADFELIVATAEEFGPTALRDRLRRVPLELAASRAQALARAVEIARGRYLLALYGSPATLLADRSLIEKLLRVLAGNPQLDSIALAEADPQLAPFRILGDGEPDSWRLGALCWPAGGGAAPPGSLELPGPRPLEMLARWLTVHGTLQWRHLPRRDRRAVAADGGVPKARLGERRYTRSRDERIRMETPPELPGLPAGIAHRVQSASVWTPPQARVLCRHLHHPTGRYRFGIDIVPSECTLDYQLGSLRVLPFQGTKSLIWDGDEFALGAADVALDTPGLLGFVEQAPLPLFDPLWLARHCQTSQRVLVSGAEDPLAERVDEMVPIGFIEPYPIHPRRPPHADVALGLVGLVRAIDLRARRHRYAVGRLPDGRLVGELGALLREPLGDCEPLWIGSDGWVSTAGRPSRNGRPAFRKALRWTGAPLTWSGFSSPGPKLRASARRSYESLRALSSLSASGAPPSGDPAGYLLRSPGRRSVPLYAGVHPVTGDQLLCTSEAEARNCGYQHVDLLGHLVAGAPVTGRLGVDGGVGIPWASRFGMVRA